MNKDLRHHLDLKIIKKIIEDNIIEDNIIEDNIIEDNIIDEFIYDGKRGCPVSGYASKFIDMYSISFIDNTLLNKLIINLLAGIYEIFFTCFSLQKEQNRRKYKEQTQKFFINLKFYEAEPGERRYLKLRRNR